ncbi:MAG: O-acetyl-ADP-ribose deacetylase [Ktedonobacteraceae bacterium]|nr:O-acetyl-ADP-ribose deacetylase [Ktedonobacteraceae bacterium]MBV9614400.1 O-acetyl-ADP-ribose deacetylase [Ktedonobacteraceae bacterium]MBV9709751.1 O-acetyl-ADP-ribose deacetylase [Ktedonobacteraceae bacterium]
MSTYKFQRTTLVLLRGNIVDVQVDAIVNAANSALAGGGGVDGAIHRAAGPTIMEECRKIGGCLTGKAVATSAGRLKAKYIFHAVGPIYGHHRNAAQLLAGAYQSCLDLAEEHQVASIAFPSISTGAYGYPLKEAASIALHTVIDHLKNPTCLQQVMFVLFSNDDYMVYEQTLTSLLEDQQ